MLKLLLWPTFIFLLPCMGIPLVGAIMVPFVALLGPLTPWVIVNCVIAIFSLVAAAAALSLLALYIDFLLPPFKLAPKSKKTAVALSNFGAILVVLALVVYALLNIAPKTTIIKSGVFSSLTTSILFFLAGIPFLFAYLQLKYTVIKANNKCQPMRRFLRSSGHPELTIQECQKCRSQAPEQRTNTVTNSKHQQFD